MYVNGEYGSGTTELFAALDPYLGIPDSFDDYNIQVYPNPAKDLVYITSDVKIQQIELINPEGRCVKHFNTNSNQLTLNVSDIAPGIYYLKSISSNQLTTKKLVIE